MSESDCAPAFIVGVGASAGGLEAIEAFFSAMPEENELGFVVVQHLSPDYKSLMVEILSKRTPMPVRRAEEGMSVSPGTIHLIPPKTNLTIFHGKLLLHEQEPTRGVNLPIDVFLRSLAEDQGERAVAVILSGTGSDGMRGVREVKQAGGMIMVQDPVGAKFDGMPRAAISTGLADFVLPADEMAEQLVAFTRHPHLVSQAKRERLHVDEDGMTRIFAMLRERCKVDFTHYKPSTVTRRVDRRMTITGVETTDEYANHLQSNPTEVTTLFRELLIGVTSFFRDAEVFEKLRAEVIPGLVESASGRELRLWVAGCSTGEEAYTLAMLIREELDSCGVALDVKIFATDIDRDALQFAATGSYPESVAADIPPEFLSRYFFRKDDHFQIIRSVREMVVFAQHNLVKDPPFTSIDLISCRNLLIYLQPVLQTKVLEFFLFSLRPDGVLLLGTSETAGEMADGLRTVDTKAKIFRSKGRLRLVSGTSDGGHSTGGPGETRFQEISRQAGALRAATRGDGERTLERFLEAVSSRFLPTAIIVNENLEVQHVVGDSRPFMQVPAGRPTVELERIVVKELSIPFVTGLQKVFREQKPLEFHGVKVRDGETTRVVDLILMPIEERRGQAALAAGLIREHETEGDGECLETTTYDLSHEAEQRIADLEQELQFSRENLQATIEELETANEELQATNEELLASNEELQSTNEELQSTNEELFTVNAEYNAKIVELSELTGDVENLLASPTIGLLLIDENLTVRRFSPGMTRLLDLTESDVGRSIERVASHAKEFDLREAYRHAETGPGEWEVETTDGAWFLLHAEPYAIGPDETSGVVISAVDITDRKRMEAELAERHRRLEEDEERYRLLVENAHAIPWEYSIPDDRWTYVAPQVTAILGYAPREWTHYGFWLDRLHPDDRGWASEYCTACTARGETHVFEYRFRTKYDSYRWIRDVVTVELSDGTPVRIRGYMIDITDRKDAEQHAEQLAAQRELLLREMSHRVKNNLATLGSLLELQAGTSGEPAVTDALSDARRRIETVRAMYELLHRRGPEEAIDAGAYVCDIVRHVVDAMAAADTVRTEIDVAEVPVAADALLPLGIVVNELITNSVKHAFPDGRGGTVRVSLAAADGSTATLSVSDDGAGFDPENAPRDGLGLTLVEGLAEQMGGRASIDSGPEGTVA
ncbi:MAG: chemotaxis protein CheB, partial [Spirochaetota bacterium]